VWTAGVAPSPLASRAGLPVDARGRVVVDEFLAVRGAGGAWALGDCAAVPDLAASAGSVASLGLHRGVAEVYGLRMRGFPAWMTHRTYHLLRLPTMNRRLRVVADWTLALLFPREVVSLDVLEHPRQDFQAALHVIAAGPSGATPIPGREERKAEDHACHR
jgi:NADH dehydrogenase